jgi:hypothetical protein
MSWDRLASGLYVPPVLGFAAGTNPLGRWQMGGDNDCCPSPVCNMARDCVNYASGPSEAIFAIAGVQNTDDCADCGAFNDTHTVPLLLSSVWYYRTALTVECSGVREARILCYIHCWWDLNVLEWKCRLVGRMEICAGGDYETHVGTFFHVNALDDYFVDGGDYPMTFYDQDCVFQTYYNDCWHPGDYFCEYEPMCDFSGASFNITFGTP